MAGRPRGLIDTGALLAVLNRNDRWHHPCTEALAALQWPLATSAAVLTELFHFLLKQSSDLDPAWDLIHSKAVMVSPIGDEDVPALQTLMDRYRDRPMDFADATLVHLARREQLDTVFTIDHDDFETYRIDGRRRFHIVPRR